ncbi:dynein regulatory complex subunit 4-like [Macrosteles quadrilineatus]|uniref:dynein regulatory complex subunit 4-like n=1 Tax=Macrosteles quadrilineatus TaxID=74068 RepID=UPI0023E34240|nr:dynein regulatory complex subunit 4-like [Macrosteles quadrilineatus]
MATKVKAVPVIVEGMDITAPNITYQRLQELSLTLYERLLLQRSERSQLMLHRDKLLTQLTNLRHEVRETETAAVNTETEVERAQECFRQQVKEVDQEFKYLEYDHKLNLDHLKTWENGLITGAEEENTREMMELLEEKRRMKETLRENEEKYEEQLTNLKKNHALEIMKLGKKIEEDNIQKELEFKRSLMEMKDEMRLRHEMETSEVEERKNCHLMELRNIHKKRLTELKHFFNSITSENLVVISNMKASLDRISKTKVIMSDEIDILKKKNKRLQKPLDKSKADVKELSRQLANYRKDLLSLENNWRLLNDTNSDLNKIKNESDTALNLLSEKKTPEDRFDPKFVKSLVQFRNHAASRRKLLVESAESMLMELENKKEIVIELSKDPDVSQAVSKMSFEQFSPRKLFFDLEIVKTAYDRELANLEEKLIYFCTQESTTTQGPWKVLPTWCC